MESLLQTANSEAEETPEELYKKALSEETLMVYSNSTRIMDVMQQAVYNSKVYDAPPFHN